MNTEYMYFMNTQIQLYSRIQNITTPGLIAIAKSQIIVDTCTMLFNLYVAMTNNQIQRFGQNSYESYRTTQETFL